MHLHMMTGIVGDTQDTWRAHRAKAFRGDLPGIDSIRRTAINYHMDMKSRRRKVEGGERSFSSVSGRGMAAMSVSPGDRRALNARGADTARAMKPHQQALLSLLLVGPVPVALVLPVLPCNTRPLHLQTQPSPLFRVLKLKGLFPPHRPHVYVAVWGRYLD